MTLSIETRPDLVVTPKTDTPADRSIEKRRIRKHAVLNVIRLQGPLSRADISKTSGFNLPSVSSLVEELIKDGLVMEEDAREVPRGRRPVPVGLKEDAAGVLGIAVGKSSTIGIFMNLSGKVLARVEYKTPVLANPDAYADWAGEVTENLISVPPRPIPPLSGIGVGLSGLLSKRGHQHSLHQAATTIQDRLEESFGIRVLVDSDARMMGLGSMWFGDGKAYSNFAVFNVGLSLSVGLVTESKILTGSQGLAGEIAILPFGSDSDTTLGDTASGSGIIRLARERHIDVVEVAEVADLARKGNADAKAVFETFAQALGQAISIVVSILNPEAVIISGRVCRSADLFFNQSRDFALKNITPAAQDELTMMLSSIDVDLAPLGAAATILHHIFYASHVQVEEVI